MKKTILILSFLVFIIPFSLFASYTLIDNIQGGQTSTVSGGINQKIRTINTGNLKFMNEGQTDDQIGNSFIGKYYDEAYGVFSMNTIAGKQVKIKSQSGACADGATRYTLEGLAYNSNFGAINFDNSSSDSEIYICIQESIDAPDYGNARFEGFAYSPYIGAQSFNGIEFEGITNIEDPLIDEDGVLGRFIKVDGIATSSNESLDNTFDDEVRVLGNVEKSSLRKNISQGVYEVIRNINPINSAASQDVSGIENLVWNPSGGAILQNDSVLYYDNLEGNLINIAQNDIVLDTGSKKTLLVRGGNVYIQKNIRGSGMLGIIVMQDDNGNGGNIYIDPSVTDIHAIMYAERSIASYNGAELGGETADSALANQLYIKGSVFSENTLGGGDSLDCPFFIDDILCDSNTAKKYDFNYLRRYRLVSEYDIDGNPTGNQIPDYSGAESYAGNLSRGHNNSDYRKFPLIIEYNSQIQQTPPPFF